MSAGVAFVCCVEAGPLESGALRVIESLRRWGGALADAPVYAVTPRPGPSLLPATVDRLDRLDAVHVTSTPRHRQRWHHYFNKYVALTEAECRSDAGVVVFLDSDLLVVGEPTELALADDVDFAAVAPDKNVGTSGPGDANEDLWRRLCEVVGVDIDELPWLQTHLDRELVRFYFNSGLFAYRPRSGLREAWRQAMEAAIWARDPLLAEQVWWVDQTVLGLAVAKLGCEWSQLPYGYNYGVASYIDNVDDAQGLADAVIVHYHDALCPEHWPSLRERLAATHPEVVAWLDDEPVPDVALAGRRSAEARFYRAVRSGRRRLWRGNGRITLDQIRRGRAPDSR